MPSADVDAGVLLGFVPLIISTAQFEPQSAFDQGSRYSEPAPTVTMWLGVPTYFAANLHAAHARRAHTDELLDTGLTSTQQRTLALCLGVTAPFLVAWALAAGLDKIIAARCDRLAGPGMLRVLAAALTVLDGALLGVVIGRLLAMPGAALVTMIGIAAACVYLQNGATRCSAHTPTGAPGYPARGWESSPDPRPGTSSTSRRCASWPRAERWPHTASGVAQPPDPRPGRDEPPPCDDELGRRHPRLGPTPDLTRAPPTVPATTVRAGRPVSVLATSSRAPAIFLR
jgi:hypothetical protein